MIVDYLLRGYGLECSLYVEPVNNQRSLSDQGFVLCRHKEFLSFTGEDLGSRKDGFLLTSRENPFSSGRRGSSVSNGGVYLCGTANSSSTGSQFEGRLLSVQVMFCKCPKHLPTTKMPFKSQHIALRSTSCPGE